MLNKIKNRKGLFISLGSLAMVMMLSASVYADAPKGPNPNDEVTGAADVARGIVQQLEDELVKHVNQTSFNAADYKAWNIDFRAKLDAETAKFEDAMQAQIVQPLQPLVDQYQEILQDTTLRPDQANALKSIQIQKLNQMTASLAPAYQAIYDNLMKGVIGFLPESSFQFVDQKINNHVSKNLINILKDVGSLGIAMDFHNQTAAMREASFTYSVKSIDGSIQPLTGTINVSSITADAGVINVSDFTTKYQSGILGACLTGKVAFDGQAMFKDAKGYQKIVTDTLNSSYCMGLAAIDAEASVAAKTKSVVYDTFIVPSIKNGCESQTCLALKQSDLYLTVNTLEQQLNRPFAFQFKDGAAVAVAAPFSDVSAAQNYLAVQVTDPTLPFDTRGGAR